ncbi:MAG TPA: hypothetical protein VEI82_07280 [Myxococcota bacterium]|nr:hypothetical protein [Myxococcota bacterium]
MEHRGVFRRLGHRFVLVSLVGLCVAALPLAARADEAPERNIFAHYGLGVGAVLCTLVYGPAKVVYATLGSVTGGLAWLLTGGRTDVPREIIQPAVRGDYVVTPEHLTFNQPLMFVGKEHALDKTSGDDNYQ